MIEMVISGMMFPSNVLMVKNSMELSMHVECDDQCSHRELCINVNIVDDDELGCCYLMMVNVVDH